MNINEKYIKVLKQVGQYLINSAESICGDINTYNVGDLTIVITFEEGGVAKMDLDKTYTFIGEESND